MLRRLSARLREAVDIAPVAASVYELFFPDGTFDLAFMVAVLTEFLLDPDYPAGKP